MHKLVILLVIAISLAGCAMQEGSKSRGVVESMTSQRGASLPEPSSSYQPVDHLPYPVGKVYEAAIEVLDEGRVSIVNENKDSGRIATDYVAGPSYSTALGIQVTAEKWTPISDALECAKRCRDDEEEADTDLYRSLPPRGRSLGR